MPKPSTQFELQAREAAHRIEAARAAGEQIALPLADEAPGTEGQRRGRGAGKATSQMREWLASRGYRMPEDVLAEMAGLATREDAFMAAMHRAEQIIAWTQGETGRLTPAQRLDVFKFTMTAQLRSAEALVPYGLAKITPDAAPAAPVQVFVQGGTVASRSDQARDVTPRPGRIAPPPMPGQIVENQGLSSVDLAGSEPEIRNDGVRR